VVCRGRAPFRSALASDIENMARTHPHAEATYRTVPLKDGLFGVEIVIPGSYPTTTSSFSTEAKAGEWIARHKGLVELNTPFDRVWRR
jgi:hypothetical protein